jgi:hypothetical protein
LRVTTGADKAERENHVMRSFIICGPQQILFRCSNKEGEMVRTCSKHGRDKNVYKIFVEKPERKRSLGNRHRWEDIIKICLKEVRFGESEFDSCVSG